MSLKAIIEFLVHLESFRNIDLFQQGLYHIRVNIYQETLSDVIINLFLNITN